MGRQLEKRDLGGGGGGGWRWGGGVPREGRVSRALGECGRIVGEWETLGLERRGL